MIFNKLFDAATPCCHNALKPGAELQVTLLMKLGVMAAEAALTCSFSSATLGDLSLHKTPSMWFQILYSKSAQSGLEGG